jgi:hypothetical protein
MSCTEYDELQRRCELWRKKMSHFMLYKSRHWQTDPKTRNLVKDTQTAILKATAEITTHQDICTICKRSLANS